MKKSVLLWAALAASAFGGPIFTVLDLGGPFSYPRAMNASGQIVGTYQTAAGEFCAFLYTPGAGMVSLETPGSSGASGVSINDIGQVIGAYYGVGGRHIFLDIPGVGMSEWAVFSPDQASVSGMNNSGQIVGDVSDSMFMPHAFVFSEDTGVFVLPTLGGLYSSAWAINNAGQIVGWSKIQPGSNAEHAFLYTPGAGIIDLGTFGGPQSSAYGVSSNGLVTGFSMLNNVTAHAFLYSPGSGVSDLGALVPGGSSVGISVNSLGQVVGNSTGQDGRYRPFLYDSGTGMVDLNSLIGPETGWRLDSAVAINDAGMIAGTGNVGGETHAFLLTRGYTAPPDAPEPATTVMAGTAIVLILAMQLRRTHRNRSRSARS